MTNQTVTAQELTSERPEMVRSVIELIMADTVSTFLEDEEYSSLRHLFIQPGEDIVKKYRQVTASIFLFDEYRQLLSLVDQLIENIGSDLFCNMLDTDENSAYSEILRCFGYGVSFWDDYSYQDFGFSERPKLKRTFEIPFDVATQILDKIAEAHPEYLSSEDEEETADNDFDQWLAENYSPAGEDASNGEQWYLSVSPNEFMPVSLSKLKEQYNSDNEIEDDELSSLTPSPLSRMEPELAHIEF